MELGSDKPQIDSGAHLRSATATTQGSRMWCTPNLFSLDSHLPECFSVFYSASPGESSFSFPPFSHPRRFLTNREQRCGRLLVPRLCVIQNPFSTPRKRSRNRAMAHVLVRRWLRSRRRIRRMGRQLVSPPSEPISHTVPVVDPLIDRFAHRSRPNVARSAGYPYTTPSKQSSSFTSSCPRPRVHRISTQTISNPSSTHMSPKSTLLFPP